MNARQDIASPASDMGGLLTEMSSRCLIPAPASWAAVDAPRPLRLMRVTVGLPDGCTSYQGRYAATMDAYEDAYRLYPDCTRITVEPVAAEVQR